MVIREKSYTKYREKKTRAFEAKLKIVIATRNDSLQRDFLYALDLRHSGVTLSARRPFMISPATCVPALLCFHVSVRFTQTRVHKP